METTRRAGFMMGRMKSLHRIALGGLVLSLSMGCVRRALKTDAGFVARVEVTSQVPDPQTAPYADCLMHIKLLAEFDGGGVAAGQAFIGVLWAFEERELGEAPTLRTGDRITITSMLALDQTDPELRRIMRVDDTDDLTEWNFNC